MSHNFCNIILIFVAFLTTLFFQSFYSPRTAYAYFEENFNGHFDHPLSWTTNNGSGLSFSENTMDLSASSQTSFPYIRSSSSIIDPDDTAVEVKFKYTSPGLSFGDGFSITDVNPPFDTVMTYPSVFSQYTMFYVWQTPGSPYFHIVTFLCPLTTPDCPSGNATLVYQTSSPDTNDHIFKIIKNGTSYSIFLDGVNYFNSAPTTRVASNIWFGHPETTQTPGTWASLSVDYLKIGTPMATVPYLSQKDLQWASEEYDGASLWAPGRTGIERWGCALTSVAMILQNYHVESPTGETVTPSNLNVWLKSQPDGYIRAGLLNWMAVTRYVRQSYESGHADTKLEFVRSYPPTTPVLPAILGVSGHFVVAHDEDLLNWQINDPADSTKTTLSKTSSILSINRFIPSHTDLSYLLFITKPGTTLSLKNEAGETTPIDWVDEYLNDDVATSSGETVRTGMVAKPSTGEYSLRVEKPTDTPSELSVYLYNALAEETTPQTFPLTDPVNDFTITYATESAGTRIVTLVDLTPPPVPVLLSPANEAHVNPSGLVLDWADVHDPSSPVIYNYQSSWNGESYGPVSTGASSYISAPGTPDQTYYWQVQACDSVANCSQWSEPYMLVVDSIRPSVDLVFPTPGPGNNYFDAYFSEDVNPVEATSGASYYLSNWPGAGGSGDLTGDATITYTATTKTAHVLFLSPDWYISPEQLWGVRDIHDRAGNLMTPNPYCAYSTPMSAPQLGSAPAPSLHPSNFTSQNWLWLSATDIGSGIRGYSTRTYSATTGQYVSDWFWLGNILSTQTNFVEGDWQLALKATDNAGNESVSMTSDTLTVDMTGPVLASQTTFTSTWYNSPQTSTFTYTDSHPRSDYDDPSCDITTESSGSYCWIKPYVCDMAGNCNAQEVYSGRIKLDMTKPKLALDTWGSELRGTANDTLSGVSKVLIQLTRPGHTDETVSAVGTTNWRYSIEDADIGQYRVRVTAYDMADNASEVFEKTYDINPTTSNSSKPSSPPSFSPTVLGAVAPSPAQPSYLPSDDSTYQAQLQAEQTPQENVLGVSVGPKMKIEWWMIVGAILVILLIMIIGYLLF